jgi:hypothetical protein
VTDAGYEIRCNSCGAAVPSTAETCPACGTVLLGPATPPPTPAAVTTDANPTASAAALRSSREPSGAAPRTTYGGDSEWTYGGLAIRGGAWLVDTVIFVPPVLAAVAFPPIWFVVLPLVWLYYPVMESSRWQATLGKHLCGLTVVTTGGKRISFTRALLRFLAKFLSGGLWGIGILMIARTSRKRGLHDMIAGTLVRWG